MRKGIAIYGAGGLGREILAMLKTMPEWEVIGFYDDGKATGEEMAGYKVLGSLDHLLQIKEKTMVVIAIGNPQIKVKLAARLIANPLISFPILIHPNALIMDPDTVMLGEGTILTAGVILTTGIAIGKHVLVNLNGTIGHDVEVGDCSSIMPGANIAGEVKIGKGVLIGSGANVLNGMEIGDISRIGAGAVVTKNVQPGDTVVGVPARSLNVDAR